MGSNLPREKEKSVKKILPAIAIAVLASVLTGCGNVPPQKVLGARIEGNVLVLETPTYSVEHHLLSHRVNVVVDAKKDGTYCVINSGRDEFYGMSFEDLTVYVRTPELKAEWDKPIQSVLSRYAEETKAMDAVPLFRY